MSAPLTNPTLTILTGETVSSAAYIGNGELVGFQMPTAWTTADITLQGSADGVTFQDVYDDNAGKLTYKAAASEYVVLRTRLTIPWIKFVSSTAQLTSIKTITLVVRKYPTPGIKG